MVPYQTQVQYVQPVQPRFYCQTYLASTPSIKTVSDVEIFMENKKMHKLPVFEPHMSGLNKILPLIYYSNKEEWNFLMQAITYHNELNVVLKNLDSDRDNKATKMLLSKFKVANFFGPNIAELREKSNAQTDHLLRQEAAISKLLQSFQCATEALPFQPEHSFGSTSVQPLIPPLVQSTIEEIQPSVLHPPVLASKSGADYLKSF